jgi:hypothetical protein
MKHINKQVGSLMFLLLVGVGSCLASESVLMGHGYQSNVIDNLLLTPNSTGHLIPVGAKCVLPNGKKGTLCDDGITCVQAKSQCPGNPQSPSNHHDLNINESDI